MFARQSALGTERLALGRARVVITNSDRTLGLGAQLPAWVARAADAGLSPRMRFLGFRRDAPAILAALDRW